LRRLSAQREIALAGALVFAVTAGFYIWEVSARAQLIAPSATPILYDRHGVYLSQIGHVHPGAGKDRRIDYGYWPLETAPDRVARAALALEDRRFYEHPGVDVWAVGRAARQWLGRSRRRSGASTIAMQIARMQHPASRSLWAKAVEAGVGVVLTQRYGRDELLRHYLRLAPFGNGSHGVAHAARFYFDKPTADLSWAEIALLSAIPQSPTLLNPMRADGLARAVRRGHRMLDELARRTVIDDAECALAHKQLADIPQPRLPQRPDALHTVLRYERLVKEGRVKAASAFDPRIRASVDLALQDEATKLARRRLASWSDAGAQQAAVMVVERETGAVVAHIGSGNYRSRHGGALDFSRVSRSPGSTLKPFIYALALERGTLKPTDVMADLPEGASGVGNADGGFLGPMLPRQALANSRNVPATNLLRSVGLDTTYRFFHELGLHDLGASADSFGLSMVIGSLPTTLERLMRAYGALANDGRLGDLVWTMDQRRAPPVRVMSADSARLVTLFLSDPLARLPSFSRYGATEYPFPAALKTGTSQGYRDAWIVVYSRKYIVGVWVGRGDAGPMNRLTGAKTAARLARDVMLQIHRILPGDLIEASFPTPEGRQPVELCVIGGKRNNGLCGQTLVEWVRPDEAPPMDDGVTLARGADGGDRLSVKIPAVHRAWAKEAGFPVDDGAGTPGEQGAGAHLSVSTPEHNSHIWRNPESPATLNRLALKAVVEPRVEQVVWWVDGEPFAVSDPDKAVLWPMTPGAHRFQVRLPLEKGRSRVVRVVIE
jgi:penicillin-binding protein 1C